MVGVDAALALTVEGGGPLTLDAWEARSDAVAGGLAAGSRVGLLFEARHWSDFAVAWLGVRRAGAVAVLFSPGAAEPDLARAVAHAGLTRLIRVEDLEEMEREQARVSGALQQAQPDAFAPSAGPVKRGSGQLIWPVNGPITGVFGEARPGHMHAGIDVAAGEGTPIRAADSGRVILMQGTGSSGGYGNFTCVQHNASTSSCYAHQSRFGTSMGANVSKGQVIGYVGNTGHSFGAHLHFEVRVNGAPTNPMGYL